MPAIPGDHEALGSAEGRRPVFGVRPKGQAHGSGRSN